MRRLRSALTTFSGVIQLSKGTNIKDVAKLGRILGELRDLDVQIAVLRHDYYPRLEKSEQKQLDKILKILIKDRKKAFTKTKSLLKGTRYHNFKQGYSQWLQQPQYTSQAQISLELVLPDLLNQQLAQLLLYPAWLVSQQEACGPQVVLLHELRKIIKATRYQGEFFTPFYGEDFRIWLKQVKMLQDLLGQVQDTEVLQGLLDKYLPKKVKLTQLNGMIKLTHQQALSGWEEVRQQYLEVSYRQKLRQMILASGLDQEKNLQTQEQETTKEILDDESMVTPQTDFLN